MEPVYWYLIGCLALSFLMFVLWLLSLYVPNLRNRFKKTLTYSLLIRRKRYWDGVTRLEAGLFFIFALANAALIAFPVDGLDLRRVESRSAFMTVINMIPLFLYGRAGPLFKVLNADRRTYANFHRFMGVTALVEAILHASIVLVLKPKPGLLSMSGAIVSYINMC